MPASFTAMSDPRFFQFQKRYAALLVTRYKDLTYGQSSNIDEGNLVVPEKHGTYGALLFDKRWSLKREEVLIRDHYACVICLAEAELEVHHRQYHFSKVLQQFKAPWDYENFLLITLCQRCHSRGHRLYKVPIIYI